MTRLLIIHFIVLALAFTAKAQTACNSAKVISPVVSKPTKGSIVSATCSTLVVQWIGAANQTYVANVSFYNATAKRWDTTYAAGICNSSQVCTATLPVTAGTKVSWSVQAKQVIDGRTFYSYYLIGERDYLNPSCTQSVVTKTEVVSNNIAQNNKLPELPSVTEKLVVYPNPATNEIAIQWSGGYKGAAVVAISDASGKEIRVLRVTKEGITFTSQIPVNGLVAGLYYVQVKPQQSGRPLTEKFLKQ